MRAYAHPHQHRDGDYRYAAELMQFQELKHDNIASYKYLIIPRVRSLVCTNNNN